jgi:hypothetical protein
MQVVWVVKKDNSNNPYSSMTIPFNELYFCASSGICYFLGHILLLIHSHV